MSSLFKPSCFPQVFSKPVCFAGGFLILQVFIQSGFAEHIGLSLILDGQGITGAGGIKLGEGSIGIF